MSLTIGTLADGKLGTSMASLYSPAGVTAHVWLSLANSGTANTYTADIGVKRSGSTNTRLLCATGTPILAASTSNTEQGRLILPNTFAGLKLSDGDSLMGSSNTDAVIDYVVFGGTEA